MLNQPFVTGRVETPAGAVPQVPHALRWADRFGTAKARWNIGRSNYRVDPGLYALGQPTSESPVLVTANYKMSFDKLRSALPGRTAWILALDTRGVNVWCAAGKGTFGHEEVLKRIKSSRLADVVSHRRIILPQLSAPGVAAHLIARGSRFRVVFGPVRADDLPAFLDAGCVATPEMRQKRFPFAERCALIPMELVLALKYGLPLCLVLWLASGLGRPGSYWEDAVRHGALVVSGLAAGIVAGAVLTPALLPWLPGRAFSCKGLAAGFVVLGVHAALWLPDSPRAADWLEIAGAAALGLALAAFLALNFTGASTYTSLSGVRKEVRRAVPALVALALVGLAGWIAARFFV